MYELVLRAPEALVEPLSDALADELGALAVTVEDADAGTGSEQALFGEPGLPAPAAGWMRSTIKALFDTERAAEAAATLLLAQAWAHEAHVQSLSALPDEDWVRLTQAQFAPIAIAPGFWIVPSWHEPPADARLAIRLDPGLAFGTGTHPTTRMCLRWLAAQAPAHAPDWERVLDYGCGSGILAIAAAKLGARGVTALDIDPAALRATQENAARNGVVVHAALPEANADDADADTDADAPAPAHAHAQPQGRYPLVLANILAKPLELLAPLLAAHVAPGGWLVLAGILERQAGELRAAYAPHLPISRLDSEEGWILMGGQRAPSQGQDGVQATVAAKPAPGATGT